MARKKKKNKNRSFYTKANREAWDEAAPIHRQVNHARMLEGFADPEFSTLDEYLRQRLLAIGVEGKSVAQICCNNGRDLLSVKRLGAGACVGFDASTPFIGQARELARVAGYKDVEFIVTDVYDIPSYHADTFDLALVTVGVLSWMPDLPAFFEVAAGLVRKGGHLVVDDIHPVLMMFEESDEGSYLAYSYFREEPWEETTGLDYYTGEDYDSKPNYSFQHTMSDILMAAIAVGFQIRHIEEHQQDISGLCADLADTEANPPMGMTLVWERE